MPNSPLDLSENEIRRLCAPLLDNIEEEASRLKHNYIGTEHIFNGLTRIQEGITTRLLSDAQIEAREIRNAIRREVGMGDDVLSENPPFTPRAYGICVQAIFLADNMGDHMVSEDQMLLSLLQEGEGVAVRKLKDMGVDLSGWITRLTERLQLDEDFEDSDDDSEELNIDLPRPRRDSAPVFDFPEHDDPMRTHPTPLLDKYGVDLTEKAKQGKIHAAIGRDKEIRSIARTLTRSSKNNPLLVGDAGVGKTAVIEGLAWMIAEGTAPEPLRDKRIVQIEIGALVAGTSLRGQFEERLLGVVDEARNAKNVILFIDEIHTIVGAGDTIDSNLDAANILKPALARGDLVCIGATTYEEYRRAVAKDPALDRRFRMLEIDEPSEDDALKILEAVYPRFEQHHRVSITPLARTAAVKLSMRYLPDRRLPDKALDLLDEACARMIIQPEGLTETALLGQVVNAQAIAEVLSEWTGIPVQQVTEDERKRFARMEDTINERVKGQEHAVKAISDAIKLNRAGLGDPKRPVGVFLLIGSSGVGKTELARAVAEFLFSHEDALLRFDMSEFSEPHTVARLIGAPAGYRGTEQGGQLTEGIKRKPYSVVLLDEVEKAAPEIFDLFLQVFDEGRLTDARGNTIDCRHAVWIMTSNIGSEAVGRGKLGYMGSPDDTPDFTEYLKKFFRPEFLNRLDEVITFNPLSREALSSILDRQLDELVERLDGKDLKLELAGEARELLLAEGFSPTEGARPLGRAIAQRLTRPLSAALLEGHYRPGAVIKVTVENGELVLKR